MTLTLDPSLVPMLGVFGIFVLFLLAMAFAGGRGRSDDGPPPDDLDEQPSPPPSGQS